LSAKKSDNKEYNYYLRQIDDWEAVRNQFETTWEKNYKAVYGPDWMQDGKRTDTKNTSNKSLKKYQYDILLSYLKTEIPSLILYRPEIFLTAIQAAETKDPNAEAEAKKYESYANRILNDIDGFENNIKAMLADGHCAYAVTKVIKIPVMGTHPQAGQSAGIDTQGIEQFYPEEALVKYEYNFKRVDPLKFIFSAKCGNDPNESRIFGEEITSSLQEMIDGGLYDEKIIDELREKFGEDDKEDDEIEITRYEIYDRFKEKIVVLCRDYDTFLRNESIPDGIDKDPYAILKFTEIPGQFIPKPEMSSGIQFQDDEQEAREWIRKQAKKSVPKKGISPQFAKNTKERNKLEDGISDTVVCTPNDVFDINTDLKLGTAVSDYMNVMDKDFDEIMGQPSQDRGMVGEAKFATEVQVAEQQGNTREQDKLNAVRTWMEQAIEKLLFQIKYGGDAELQKLNIDLDLDIEINIESKTLRTRAIERKQMIEAGTGYPMLWQSPTYVSKFLDTFDMREIDKIQQEIQQAQAAQMQANQPQGTPPKEPSISVSFKGELIPTETANAILDTAFNKYIPYPGTQALPPGDGGEMSTGESPAAGTEGLQPEVGVQ
jgi:hypothetical protein